MQSTSAQLDRDILEAVLAWQAVMGVDLAIGDMPIDRFAQSITPPQQEMTQEATPELQRQPRPGKAASASIAPPAQVEAQPEPARQRLEEAQTLAQLQALLEQFDECALKSTAARLVFSDGNPAARVMLVGDAPGADDEREGRPFSGRVGALLDKMLAAIGLDRTQVYLANMVPWRPPGNRAPNPREIAQLRPFILRQIELAQPEFLIPLGTIAMQSLLQTDAPPMRLRGQALEFVAGAQKIRAFPMLHPIYLLRQPSHKRHAWQDLQALQRALAPAPPKP
ncbi:MAG: uracil-DNA glycosylase [Hyphomicrobiales bacterium]|nr:uracil-DNA glycosylase [Hyphomicrobiales bacterium]MDE2115823.1 uracil-DNA glycosylase [Hyphomicrobiales bacterium]